MRVCRSGIPRLATLTTGESFSLNHAGGAGTGNPGSWHGKYLPGRDPRQQFLVRGRESCKKKDVPVKAGCIPTGFIFKGCGGQSGGDEGWKRRSHRRGCSQVVSMEIHLN